MYTVHASNKNIIYNNIIMTISMRQYVKWSPAGTLGIYN